MLKFFFKKQLNRSWLAQKSGGFTLIEVLVAMVISSIIIGTLLTFTNNILSSERKEQAKTNTEQELQTAIDYITNDLKEAIYIYDATGIAAIKNQLPSSTATDKVPVLVFWKRVFLRQDKELKPPKVTAKTTVGCLVKLPPGNTVCDNRDYFVYSLVAYYLIKDNNPIWSSAARIGRFEIQDGIRDPYNSNNYLTLQDSGFKLFNLKAVGTLKDKMNAWTKDTASYTQDIEPLVDYIDQSTGAGVLAPNCTNNPANTQQVPANNTTANPLGIYSFYACVDSSKTLARVYIRGNSMARLQNSATYSNNLSTYFPSANVLVKSRGLLSGE